jgi:hypothetical protein
LADYALALRALGGTLALAELLTDLQQFFGESGGGGDGDDDDDDVHAPMVEEGAAAGAVDSPASGTASGVEDNADTVQPRRPARGCGRACVYVHDARPDRAKGDGDCKHAPVCVCVAVCLCIADRKYGLAEESII